MKKIIALFVLASICLACSSAMVASVPSAVPMNTPVEKVGKAIMAGGAERGWIAKQLTPDTIELSLLQREHQVTVDVVYTNTSYAINYKSSQNMKYNPSNGTIHNKYGKWVNLLRRSIDKNLL